MKTHADQKLKLEQKKNRLILEETRLRLKERKMRTRHLIEIGGLVTKAGLDHLQTNTLYGALLSLSSWHQVTVGLFFWQLVPFSFL